MNEIRKMYKDSGKESAEGLKQFENLVMNAKQGLLGNSIQR